MKVFLIITLVLTSISLFFNISNSISIIKSIKDIAYLSDIILGLLYQISLIIYLLFIMLSKDKNLNKINLIFLVVLVICSIFTFMPKIISTIRGVFDTFWLLFHDFKSSIIIFIQLVNTFLSFVLRLCLIITSYGIVKKKKMPYKSIMIVSLVFNLIIFVTNIVLLFVYKKYYITLQLENLLHLLLSILQPCCFTIFMYLYAININEIDKNKVLKNS